MKVEFKLCLDLCWFSESKSVFSVLIAAPEKEYSPLVLVNLTVGNTETINPNIK